VGLSNACNYLFFVLRSFGGGCVVCAGVCRVVMGLQALAGCFVGLGLEVLGAGAAAEEAGEEGLHDGAEDDLGAPVEVKRVSEGLLMRRGGGAY